MQPDDELKPTAATEEDRSEQWLKENREAIEAYNRRIDHHPTFGDIEKLFSSDDRAGAVGAFCHSRNTELLSPASSICGQLPCSPAAPKPLQPESFLELCSRAPSPPGRRSWWYP